MKTFSVNLEREALERLIQRWKDPEFWRTEGAMMDSLDCADELRSLLHQYTSTSGTAVR